MNADKGRCEISNLEFLICVYLRSSAVQFFCLALTICGSVRAGTMPLDHVRTFMYQLQNIEDPAALDVLAKSDYDLLVIEPTANINGQEKFDIKSAVAKLHEAKPGRIVLAYLDAGQAESFRAYWKPDWIKPTKTSRGHPDFILTADPDGWSDDYNVAYWDPRWQKIFNADVATVMTAGFDGVYLDWIDAFDDDKIAAEAKKQNIKPANAMVDFLLSIRKTARQINPAAIVVQQNAVYLLDADPRLTDAIDAVGVEDTWFSGKANAKWGSSKAGDIPNRYKDDSSTDALLKQYAKFQKLGKPVFTIDYCVKPENAAKVYQQASARGLIPLVTQVSLDHLTTTPPPNR